MVRKIIVMFSAFALIFAFGVTAHGATYNVYDEGTLNTTYTTYFRDIVAGVGLKDEYVAFRSGQYEYTLIIGQLEYENGVISSQERCTTYTFRADGTQYNNQYKYYVDWVDTVSLDTENHILYSSVGDFPQLIERGANYEVYTAVLLTICCVSVVIGRIINPRKR